MLWYMWKQKWQILEMIMIYLAKPTMIKKVTRITLVEELLLFVWEKKSGKRAWSSDEKPTCSRTACLKGASNSSMLTLNRLLLLKSASSFLQSETQRGKCFLLFYNPTLATRLLCCIIQEAQINSPFQVESETTLVLTFCQQYCLVISINSLVIHTLCRTMAPG